MKYVHQEESEVRSDDELEKLSSNERTNELMSIKGLSDDFDESSCIKSTISQFQRITENNSEDEKHPAIDSNESLLEFINEGSERKTPQTSSEHKEDIIQFPKKKKMRRQILADSDSDEGTLDQNKSSLPIPNESSVVDEGKNFESLGLTDISEEVNLEEVKGYKKKKIKKPFLDDSDSEGENISKEENALSLELGEVDKVDHKSHSYKSMFQNTDLYDAEGSSEEESASVPENKHDSKIEKSGSKSSKKRTTSQRKSKQTALEEIRSETQRLIRHSRVSLPYHQPKQRTLSEFLSRRKVVPLVPLKTSSDQLSEVWKSIEEREKIAEEFYKSESDCSEDEIKPSADKTKNSFNSLQSSDTNQVTEASTVNVDQSIPVLETVIQELAAENNQKAVHSENTEPNVECISKPQRSEDSSNPQISEDSCHEKEPTDGINSCDTNIKTVSHKCSESHSSRIQNEPLSEYSEEFRLVLLSEKENECNEESSLTIQSEVMRNSLGSKPILSSENSENLDIKKKRSLLNNSLLDIKLDVIPKISGSPDGMIDLEKAAEKPSALKLVSRFMKHVSLKPKFKKQEEKVSIAITEVNEKGEVINLTEEILNIKSTDTTKPGETRVQLKTKLKQKIAQNREEQFVKRIEEYKLNEEMFDGEKEVCSDLEEDIENEIEPSLSSETESEPEENDVDLTDKCDKKENPFIDEEADESENEGDEEAEESIAEDETEADNYSDADSIDIAPLVNDKEETSNQMDIGHDNSSSANVLDKSGLLALCSGMFPSQTVNLKDLEKNDNAEAESESLKLFIPEDATLDFCGTERKSINNDDDYNSDDEILKRKPKKKMKLEFSDDEDDDNSKLSAKSAKSNKSSESDEDDDIPNENEEELGEYEEEEVIDEEEAEVFQNPSAAAKRFLEDEAELSGSEYGSADEDEVDLDNYEEEQGDKDKINQKKLRDELGKIHMKEIMDEDKREIRILQELLLEDGELHSDGPKRQRQFKWYNQDDADTDRGIFLSLLDEDDNDGDGSKETAGEQEEDESWRKTRLARENYLRELQKAEDDKDLVNSIKKFNKLDKSTSRPSPKLHTLPSPNPKKQFSLITKRGSFLNRGEKLLSKLAEMTNASNEKQLGNTRSNKNMVFAVVSPPKEKEPEEQQVKKRKSTASLPSATKRLKFSPGSLNSSGRKSLFEVLD